LTADRLEDGADWLSDGDNDVPVGEYVDVFVAVARV
jgi:hypothetical protein